MWQQVNPPELICPWGKLYMLLGLQATKKQTDFGTNIAKITITYENWRLLITLKTSVLEKSKYEKKERNTYWFKL